MFIKQVFYGVMRYSDFLKIFTNKLFKLNIATTERKDEYLYQIFAYLLIFRIEELPIEDFRNIVYVRLIKNKINNNFHRVKIL
jgi:hypothetical protein